MSSHYSLKVISNMKFNITEVLHALSVNALDYNGRKLKVNSMDVSNLDEIFAVTSLNPPLYINFNGIIYPNLDNVQRSISVMTNMLDRTFSLDDEEIIYKKGLHSAHILTSTRIEDGIDVIEYFNKISKTLHEILPGHELTVLYRDETKDPNNYVIIDGNIECITLQKVDQ